jgi:hypothetical protein
MTIDPNEYYTVEAAALATGRSEQAIRRYIRLKTVESIPDPSDGRRKLIPVMELGKVVRQPMKGRRLRPVRFIKGDGTTIVRILRVAKEATDRPHNLGQ